MAELVAGCGTRVYPVGRLDLNSEGLLLMTNDGALTQKLTHPSSQIEKSTWSVLQEMWKEPCPFCGRI